MNEPAKMIYTVKPLLEFDLVAVTRVRHQSYFHDFVEPPIRVLVNSYARVILVTD